VDRLDENRRQALSSRYADVKGFYHHAFSESLLLTFRCAMVATTAEEEMVSSL